MIDLGKEKNILNHTTGYGLINRDVMRNKEVSMTAKCIYAYLVSFAGNSMEAYPSQKLISEELGISNKTIKKYIKELKNIGLIKVEQKKSPKGSFMHNTYTLTDTVGQILPHDEGQNLHSVGGKYLPPNNNSINNNSDEVYNVELSKKEKKNKDIDEVLTYLNKITHKNYNLKSNSNRENISGRLDEGYTVEDFITVIDNKALRWLNNKKMQMYLRPSTLFAPKNFDNYLNEGPVKDKRDKDLEELKIGYNY